MTALMLRVSQVLGVAGNLLESDSIDRAGHSCDGVIDMLVDWPQVRDDLSAVLDAMFSQENPILKYWEHIRPQTHTLDNIATFTGSSDTFGSCRVGYFAVKAFMAVWSPQREDMQRTRFREDWEWFLALSPESFQQLLVSKWAYVLFSSWRLLSQPLEACDDGCPQAVAFEAFSSGRNEEAFWALSKIDRSDGFGLFRALGTSVPLAQLLASPAESARDTNSDLRMSRVGCRFQVCSLRSETTPLDASCSCGKLFPQASAQARVCIFMVDSRPVESMVNITEVLAARFWSLAFEANRLYAEHRGYSIDYVVPDEELHYPARKVGWAKVKVILEQMEARLPASVGGCDAAVSIDSDAYFRGTESIESVMEHYMVGKDILFSQEYHTEDDPGNVFINGGFFIVRNTAGGRQLLRDWYEVPERESHISFKKENPQGLNYCWDSVMQPLHGARTVLAPFEYFSCPRGQFIRHNWFKDLSFEAELQEAVLQRRAELSPGCILCGEFHLIDLVRHESGKGWINNR